MYIPRSRTLGRAEKYLDQVMPMEPSSDDQAQSPRASALYIGRMSEELARLARRHHLEPLAYLLEMARIEADQIAKGSAEASEVA